MSVKKDEYVIIEFRRNDELWNSNHSNPSCLAIGNDFIKNVILTPVSY